MVVQQARVKVESVNRKIYPVGVRVVIGQYVNVSVDANGIATLRYTGSSFDEGVMMLRAAVRYMGSQGVNVIATGAPETHRHDAWGNHISVASGG
jgi:hypothetical protein